MRDAQRPWIIGIGASGGKGLRDVREMLATLPSGLEAVVLVVLHRTQDKPSYLRDVLDARSNMPVEVAGDGQRLKAGVCYIGEPGEHLNVRAGPRAQLVKDSTKRNRTVDLLFHSMIAVGTCIIGVVLSGSLDDGARGLREINHAGGVVMTLLGDETASAGMPENALKLDGPMDFVGTVAEIAARIVRCIQTENAMAAVAPPSHGVDQSSRRR